MDDVITRGLFVGKETNPEVCLRPFGAIGEFDAGDTIGTVELPGYVETVVSPDDRQDDAPDISVLKRPRETDVRRSDAGTKTNDV